MKKIDFLWICLASLFSLSALNARAQKSADSLTKLLLGRWEVVAYSEQDVPVNKKNAAVPKAQAVYKHNRQRRAKQWYGLTEYDELNWRQNRNYEEWLDRDSMIEVRRLAEAIATPYYVVFFADRWQAQVLLLTGDRMTLFLPEEAEIVELERRPFTLP